MNRRNFLKSLISVSVIVPTATGLVKLKNKNIKKRKNKFSDFEYDDVYIYSREEFLIPSNKKLEWIHQATYYGMGYQIFSKFKNIKDFAIKYSYKKMIGRLQVDVSDKKLIALKKFVDDNKPVSIFLEYENYNIVI